MAHEFETGFFVRQPAWHKLGTVLTDAPSTREAFVASGLNWSVNLLPLFAESSGSVIPTPYFALTRDSDSAVLGSCSKSYRVFQNSQAFEWCEPLVDTGYWDYEAAGALKGGQVCWTLLKQGEVDIIPGDKLNQYLLMTWAHDGSSGVRVMPTSIRVVCNNTLQAALRAGTVRSIRHSANMTPKLREIQALYLDAVAAFDEQTVAFKKQLDITMTDAQIEQFVDTFLDKAYADPEADSDADVSARAATNSLMRRNTLLNCIYNGSGMKELGVSNTLYGAFQGSSEAIEHFLSPRSADRGASVLFGSASRQLDTLWQTAQETQSAVLV